MAYRFTHDKDRLEGDRLKDLPQGVSTAADRTRGRTPDGKFSYGNLAALGRGWRGLIRDSLGPATDDQIVQDLSKLALATYKADIASMPCQSPGVLQECAAAARRTVLATHYANEAAKAGLTTPLGLELSEASRVNDLAARQHRNAAFTRSAREAADQTSKPISPKQWAKMLAEASKPVVESK